MRLSLSLTKPWLGVMALLAAASVQAGNGQITSFGASSMSVTAGTLVDFYVGFGIDTISSSDGGSNPIEPEPVEGYQFWNVNWYSTVSETVSSVYLEAAGNSFFDSPSAPPGSGYGGGWMFSVLFPTEGSFDITVTGGWQTTVETYRSNENASRDCFNNDPGGTNEQICSSWQYQYDDGSDSYSAGGSFASQTLTIQVAAVPEPESLAMLLAGAGVLLGARRFRQRP